MTKLPVIAIYDVGKTNKKLFLFNEQYEIVYEKQARFAETEDEDGDPCEDIAILTESLHESLREVLHQKEYDIRAINYSTYGASFVYLDDNGNAIPPLYNYLKAFPSDLEDRFYEQYGGRHEFARCTASPILGNLNAGLQLYRLKYQHPSKFARIVTALHLPQYMSYLLTGKKFADLTSIGCHTALWDFNRQDYHRWVAEERLDSLLPPVTSHATTFPVEVEGRTLQSGLGLHDSSAALIPYLLRFKDPFILLSTGTWSISMNPFNHDPLTDGELEADCLCYFSFEGKPVKSSRLFAGRFHDDALQSLNTHFSKAGASYKNMLFDASRMPTGQSMEWAPDRSPDWHRYVDFETAYHALIAGLVRLQEQATRRILKGHEKQLFVDGGFSNNTIFMQLLANAFPELQVYAAVVAQSTALGTAMAIHSAWNQQTLPEHAIILQQISPLQ